MKSKKAKACGFQRSPCPVASALDLIGDKWSLVVVRDLFRGKTTYGDLLRSPERIPTNILAERLRRLEAAAIIRKSAYQKHPVRYVYTLSDKGKELEEILRALVKWGTKHIKGTMFDEPRPDAK